ARQRTNARSPQELQSGGLGLGQSARRQAGVGGVRGLSARRQDGGIAGGPSHLEGRRRQTRGRRMKIRKGALRPARVAPPAPTPPRILHAQKAPLQDKPFAEHKIVLQLSDNDVRKQNLVISVANNLLKFYDPDKVAIEVVAFGPGIEVLRTESPARKQVESLI